MTKVRFTFVDVQGNPLPLMEFKLIVRRASFNDEEVGVTLPEQLTVVTDATGQVIVDLWPLKTAYRIQIAEEYEELCGKLNWSFYVPHTDQIVEAQSLFLVPAPNNIPWDEEAIGKITQAVIDSHDSAVAADASADRAELAATTVAGDAQSARDSAEDALLSKNSAAASATTASDAATAAGLSKVAAKASEDAADASELAAEQSAATAGTQAGVATDAGNLAKRWASDSENVVVADGKESSYSYSRKSATSATSAADSAGISGTQAGLATAAKTAAEAAALTATAKAGEASASAATALTEANRSKEEADRAQGYASALTGSLVEAGSIDLSSNQYPAKPQFSSFWKVVVGGVVGGVDYGIGDTLVYSKTLDQFYKIDNTESVSSVNGKTGALTLVKADVGLSQVDNTSDANKPVSTAQQTALNGKQASAANLTAFAGLTGAVDQLPYFTGAGALSLATLTAKARLLMARTDTAGMQDELGLVKAVNNNDPTVGRLISVGNFGLGSTESPRVADANAQHNQGVYSTYNTAGLPAGYTGAILGTLSVMPYSIDWTVQIYAPIDTSPRLFVRNFYSATTWSAWVPVAMGDVVASNSDTTVGRLLTVGYGGLGISNNGSYLGINLDPDTYLTGSVGLWGSFLINGVSTNGFLSVVSGEGGNYYQRFVNRIGAVSYERTANVGVWTPWSRMHTTANSLLDPALNTGGLMSATVVSGWTIEKFANGTCIVAGAFTSASLAANSQTSIDTTIPSVLVGETVAGVTAAALPTASSDVGAVNAFMVGNTVVRLYARNGAAAQPILFRIKIIGRWK